MTKKQDATAKEREALLAERAEIVDRLGAPKRDQIRLEEIDQRLAVIDQPEAGVEYVFRGSRDPDDHSQMPTYRTVVEIGSKFHVVDPEWRFDGLEGSTPPFSEADYERAFDLGKLWRGGYDNLIDKDTAQRLIDAGFEVRARKAQPQVTYGSRQHAVANPNV